MGITASLVFLSSGLIVVLLNRRGHTDRAQSAYAERVAVRLLGGAHVPGVGEDARVKRLADLVAALAPVLALFGTIISAVVTYLARAK